MPGDSISLLSLYQHPNGEDDFRASTVAVCQVFIKSIPSSLQDSNNLAAADSAAQQSKLSFGCQNTVNSTDDCSLQFQPMMRSLDHLS